ncbi:hypothetical protein Aau02nite_63420 [Amorphoplanes auranticolor]|uniref:Uncharacterized protein n=2 Tax=Actinoplanes auranticolor TaxID=47988 RepID=A0A919SMM5_9ACTN|nr:hypothetical protein Aau02nite_63420 [Actinoplanes auranticolor]
MAATLAAATVAACSVNTPDTTSPTPSADDFVARGYLTTAAATTPSPPPDAFVQEGRRTGSAVTPTTSIATSPSGTTGRRGALTKAECETTTPARTSPGHLNGWVRDSRSWCARGRYVVDGQDTTGRTVSALSAEFMAIATVNDSRDSVTIDVYIDDVTTNGMSVDWNQADLTVAFTGCPAALRCPPATRASTPADWQKYNQYRATLDSEFIAPAGVQLIPFELSLQLRFATPKQPEWQWKSDVEVAAYKLELQ